MIRWLARRVLGLCLTLLATTFVVFMASQLAPGDTARLILGGSTDPTPQALAAVRAEYHLDDPVLVQYARWLGGLVNGNLGQSTQTRASVSSMIEARIPTTAALVALSLLLIAVVGMVVGVVMANRPGAVDATLLTITGLAIATPSYVAAIGLVAAFALDLSWFPTGGPGRGVFGELYHLTLPAIALSFSAVAMVSRVTRASVIDGLGRDHVDVARSRGIRPAAVLRRHVVRNSLPPVLTVLGSATGALVVGATVVETAFNLPGLGSLLVQSVEAKDYPAVQGIVVVVAAVFVLATLVVDVVQYRLDPPARLVGKLR